MFIDKGPMFRGFLDKTSTIIHSVFSCQHFKREQVQNYYIKSTKIKQRQSKRQARHATPANVQRFDLR